MKLLGKLILISVFITGCNAGPNQTNIEVVQNMMDQENLKAQDWDPSKPDMRTMLVPPEGTVPRGFKPYTYGYDVLKAEAELKNPFASQVPAPIMALGKKQYDINCAVCHGATGQGDGPLSKYEKITRPIPSLVTDIAKKYKDGRFFHIIMRGQGMMGGYSRQVKTDKERWAVVSYIRSMQQ